MKIKRSQDTTAIEIDFNSSRPTHWIDDNGVEWSNPTWEFMQARGFEEMVDPPVVETPEAVAQRIADQKERLISQIADAADRYVNHEVNASLLVQIWANYNSATPHPMVIANMVWGSKVLMDAEQRKAMVMYGVAVDPFTISDFSSHGKKPHSVMALYVAGIVRFPNESELIP